MQNSEFGILKTTAIIIRKSPVEKRELSRYHLDMIRFDWDTKKNEKNRKKHGVWFEEAQQVFDDPSAILYFDSKNSDSEDRFILLGMSGSQRVLVVVHCERHEGSTIRLISARKATRKEVKDYEKGI